MDAKYEYLEGRPEGCLKSCDVLVKLDDGSELPVHSRLLALYSNVVADMCDDGPLSTATAKKKAKLPLTDCTRAAAIMFLKVVYSKETITHINQATGLAVASIAHKLDMKVPFIRILRTT